MIQNVKEYINPETTIPKVQVEACVIATNPVIKKAIIIGNACGVPDCKNKTLIDFDQQTIVPSQTPKSLLKSKYQKCLKFKFQNRNRS